MDKLSLIAQARNEIEAARRAPSGRSAKTVHGGHEKVPRPDPAGDRQHVAARLEDRLNTVVGGWLTGRGWVPRVEPYTGYGAPGWVRVMARAVLAPPGTSAREVAETDLGSADRAVRGWRGFFTAKVPFGTVQVRIGGRTHDARADRGGQDHKRQTLRRLLAELPDLQWVLVGDGGQHDPQIYADVAAEHPDRVRVVAIRQLSPAEQVLSHGTPGPAKDGDARDRPAVPVVHGADGNEIALRLIDAGLL